MTAGPWTASSTNCAPGASGKPCPREFGAPSTVHDRFQWWASAGVFAPLWHLELEEYDALQGLEWTWLAMDGAMTKAPLGGEATGPNPTDRSERGTKCSLLTEGHGLPLSIAVDGANQYDLKLVESTLAVLAIAQPDPAVVEQHLCLDKGYDYPEVRDLVAHWGYTAHIRSLGEERQAREQLPGYRARRWVVERTHAWLHCFHRLVIRWEKYPENCLGLLHLACAWMTFRAIQKVVG